MTISGETTNTQPLKPEDLPHVLRFRNADLSVGEYKSIADLQHWYDQIQHNDQRSAFLITTTEETPIGEIVYTQRNSQIGEVNVIRLGREYRNQGFGTDAMKAFCHHILSTTATSNIILFVNQENQIAIRCYEKCGFEKISVQKAIDGKSVLVVMELKKPNF